MLNRLIVCMLRSVAAVAAASVKLLNSIKRQEVLHARDRQIMIADHARLVGEDQQLAKMRHGSSGFQATNHSKMTLIAV